MHWKTVWAAEPDFVAVVFLKDSLPCKVNLCGFPRLTLVAYIRHTRLSSSRVPTTFLLCAGNSGGALLMREQSEWLLMYHWDEDCGIYTANSIRLCIQYFRNTFFPTTFLGRFFFLPTIIWLQLQSLKSFTWLWLCSAISPFFPPLLFCFLAFIQVVIMFYGSRMDSCKALKTVSQCFPLGCFKPTSSFLLKQNLPN